MAFCGFEPSLKLEDEIVCHNYNAMDRGYQTKQAFLNQEYMYVPRYYKCLKDFKAENDVIFPACNRLCDREVVLYRGQNNVAPEHLPKQKNSFLIPYCECNKYDNSIICNQSKCCSKSHQLFFNQTKRQGVRGCPTPCKQEHEL